MKTVTIKRIALVQGLLASAKQLALVALFGILMIGAMQAQETQPAEAAPDAQQQSSEQTAAEKDAPPPADGLLEVNEPEPSVNQVVDGDFIFTSPGQSTYSRDIRLSDNFGGLRFIGADSLTTSPAGAAIQLFGNNASSFNGQLFLDSGADNFAALIFRTAQTGGTITERMRVRSDGNVGIGTTNPLGARVRVLTGPGAPIVAMRAESTSSGGFGVIGISTGSGGTGVDGSSNNGTGVNGFSNNSIGVNGFSSSGIAVRGTSTNGFAGHFEGNVQITGNLTKGSGSFKIDHPLDPANKYLSHSFVESPDMMNIYNGIIVLDAKGEATVTLPQWLEALNREFRYQLTAVGAPGPNLYVAGKIKGNQFKIAGGKRGMEVSWQVTGVRQDAYAEKHRIKVEEEKTGKERGTYLHPEVFGQPTKKGIEQARHPE